MSKKLYKITLFSAEYGHVLNSQGEVPEPGDSPYQPEFETLEAAFVEKERLLKEFVYAGIVIKHAVTGKATREYFNDDVLPLYLEEKKRYIKWTQLPFYQKWTTPEPECKYYKNI